MESDLDSELMSVDSNHPYVGFVSGSSSVQVFLVAEREVLQSPCSDCMVFLEVIYPCIYYAFNMVYPRGLYPVLILIRILCLD